MNKWKKRETTDGVEQANYKSIKSHREKESYKYLGILEIDAIRQTQQWVKFTVSPINYTPHNFCKKLICFLAS